MRRGAFGETGPVTVVLVGTTATGKSRLAVDLARAYADRGVAAEVVNADSMLVYRGMDVGTAKPTATERAGVRHHLVDIYDVRRTATVAQFQALARAAIQDCRDRRVVPVVVGGSALYVRAILDDFTFPATDPVRRAALEADLTAVGPETLHLRLAALDPAAAARIEPANGRRTVRALEVIAITGQPYSAELPQRRYLLPGVVQIGLSIPRPVLDERIARRVQLMWDGGLIAEVRRLEAAGLRDGVTASRGLGYRQVLSFLDGEITEELAQEQTVVGTRKFARRQDSWFLKDERIHWLAHDRPDLVSAAYALAGPGGSGPGQMTH